MTAPVRGDDALRALLWDSETLYAAQLGADGAIAAANPALELAAGRPLAGVRFAELLAAPQRPALQAALDACGPEWTTLTVAVLDPTGGAAEDRRLHLRCQDPATLLVAEPAGRERERLVEQVLALNDDLIASQRALGRRQRELEQARTEAEQALRRLASLEGIALAGLSNAGLDDVLHALLVAARDVLNGDRATVLLLDDRDEDTLIVRAAVGLRQEVTAGVRVPVGEGVAGAIAATRRGLVVDDLRRLHVPSRYVRAVGRSLAGVPLLVDGQLVGVLHVSALATGRFDEGSLRLLELVADRAALAIAQAQLRDRERRIGETLQRSLLPERLADVAGVRLAARYAPRAHDVQVGGDFYDAVALPGGAVGLVIGDVAGKGLPAAVAMGHLRSAVRAHAADDLEPGELPARLERVADEDERIATATYLRLDPATGEVRYANAGHPPVLHLPGDGGAAGYLGQALAPPLGSHPPARPTATTRVGLGSRLLLYTDGLVERRTVALSDDLARLARLAVEGPLDLDALCDRLLDAFGGESGGFSDDVALLAVGVGRDRDPGERGARGAPST